MPELPFFRHVRQFHVIRHDVALQPQAQGFAQARLCIQQQRFGGGMNTHISRDAAFGVSHAGVERFIGLRTSDVIGHLAVEVAHTIRAGQAQLGAGGKIHGGPVLGDGFKQIAGHAA